MKNTLLAGALVIGLSSCSAIDFLQNDLPDNFDNVEFGYLVELNVLASEPVIEDYCRGAELRRMDFLSSVLVKYSANTLNRNTTNIYKDIKSLTTELKDKQEPSPAYCKIKRQSIAKATDSALETFGRRMK